MQITAEEYAKLSDLLNGVFKYQIGEIVQPSIMGDFRVGPSGVQGMMKETNHEDVQWILNFRNNLRFTIVERVLQQCHGGIQKKYWVRPSNSDGGTTALLEMSEFELSPSKPFLQKTFRTPEELKKWVDGEGK